VRVVAASNRDLKTEGEAGRFRGDLYYRLSVIQIDIPPLRERGDDTLLLAAYYIKDFGERLRLRKKISGLAPEVRDIFLSYAWPGNVRELRNVIERALILEDDDLVTTEYLPRDLTGRSETAALHASAPAAEGEGAAHLFKLPPEGVSLEAVESSLVRQAIERSGGNQTRAAELLGVSRDQLRYRLKKLDSPAPESQAATEAAH
jgi:DNA-binding NtrC family response regulator